MISLKETDYHCWKVTGTLKCSIDSCPMGENYCSLLPLNYKCPMGHMVLF